MEPESEHSDFDINALLASINSNLEVGLQGSQKDLPPSENPSLDAQVIPESPEKRPVSPLKSSESSVVVQEEKPDNVKNSPESTQKSNVFTIVRDAPEVQDEMDPLLKTLEKIKITNSLLTNEECTSFSIDTQKIQTIYESIVKNYDRKISRVHENQRKIYEMMSKVKISSQIPIGGVNQKEMPYLKMKNSDKEGKFKQIKALDQDAEKSKYYLLSIIHRLESLEFGLDKLIDYNLKNKK